MEEMGYQDSDYNEGISCTTHSWLADDSQVFDYDLEALHLSNNKQQEEPEHFRLDYFTVQSGLQVISLPPPSWLLACGDEIKAEAANGNGPVDEHLPCD